MESIILNANKRSGTAANNLRKSSIIPAVVYGHKQESTSLEVNESEFIKLFREAGRSTIITLRVDGKDENVLVHDVQYHPTTSRIVHLDFYIVDMNKPITADVPLKFVGVSPAIKSLGGMVLTAKNALHVKCLPADLIHEIEIDMTKLENLGDSVHVRDIVAGDKISFTDNPDDMILSIAAPRKAAEASEEDIGAPVADVVKTVADEKAEAKEESKDEVKK